MKREQGRKILWLVVLFLMAFPVGNVWGLTDEEIFRDFRFNFIIPGARSTGLGGAFIAAADDTTAAEANPAALHSVTRDEVFAEYRWVKPETQVFGPTQSFGSNDVNSTEPFLDYQSVNAREDQGLVSFLSYAHPFRWRRATLAFSRSVLLNVQSSLTDEASGQATFLDVSLTNFPVVVDPGPPPVTERYSVSNDVEGILDAEIVNYNLAFAFSMTRNFSLGLTATYSELSMLSKVNSVTQDPLGVLSTVHPRVDVGGVASEIQLLTNIDDTDTAFAYTIGLHWHPDTAFASGYSPLRFGLVYRQGARFEVTQTQAEVNPATGSPEGAIQFANTLKVPDRWGFGVSYEIGRHWLLALDIERIQYSDLLENYVAGVNFFTSTLIQDLLQVDPDSLVFDVDDATVPRFGVEYNFTSRRPWTHSIRAGYYNDPDSRIYLVNVETGDPQNDELLLDLFSGGEDIDHYTVGFTLGMPGNVQLQAAGDFSDVENQGVVSIIWRFGGVGR
jgi:long-subunit fatty acid transport protein